MTTTAFDDQFIDAPEPVRQPYDTASILRRNVADLEIALKQQTERAEAAEAELLAVREDNHSMMLEIDGLRTERDRLAAELAKLAKQKPALYMAFSDCGNFIRYWTRDTKNLEATMSVNDFEVLKFYAAPVPAPAVPEEWKCAVSEFLSSHDEAWAELFKALPADTRSVPVSYHQAESVRKANVLRALLQSAPQAPDAAADRLLEDGE